MKFFKKILVAFLLTSNFYQAQDIKIDWTKYFGGERGLAKRIIKSSDGGFLIVGNTESEHPEAVGFKGKTDGYVVKVNANFDLEWSKVFGTAFGDYIKDVKQTRDGGYIFVGWVGIKAYDLWAVKLDYLGNIIWDKNFGGSEYDYAESVEETQNGKFIITGSTRSSDGDVSQNLGYSDYWVVTLDTDGSLISEKSFGGSENDFGMASVINSDGTFLIAGESLSKNYNVNCRKPVLTCESDFWIFKSNSSNTIEWTQCFGSERYGANYFNRANDIIQTTDNGYVIVGSGYDSWVANTFGKSDFWIRKIDANGNLEFKNFYGGSKHDKAYSVKQTLDGGYIIVGESRSSDDQVNTEHLIPSYIKQNGWIVKTDKTGNLEWQKVIGGSGYDLIYDVIELSLNNYIVVGRSWSNDYDFKESEGRGFWASKISVTPSLNINNNSLTQLTVYPNIVDNTLFIKTKSQIKSVEITDVNGRKINNFYSSKKIESLDVTSLSSGVYFLTLSDGFNTSIKKIIKK